jgi:hypothetical protein
MFFEFFATMKSISPTPVLSVNVTSSQFSRCIPIGRSFCSDIRVTPNVIYSADPAGYTEHVFLLKLALRVTCRRRAVQTLRYKNPEKPRNHRPENYSSQNNQVPGLPIPNLPADLLSRPHPQDVPAVICTGPWPATGADEGLQMHAQRWIGPQKNRQTIRVESATGPKILAPGFFCPESATGST